MSLTHNIIAGVLWVDRKDGGATIMKITMNRCSVNLTMVVVVLKEGALPCPICNESPAARMDHGRYPL
jgi:hypothetical protein